MLANVWRSEQPCSSYPTSDFGRTCGNTEMTRAGANSNVYPSGAERTASAVPTVPPAPGLFRTTNCCPKSFDSPTARARAKVDYALQPDTDYNLETRDGYFSCAADPDPKRLPQRMVAATIFVKIREIVSVSYFLDAASSVLARRRRSGDAPWVLAADVANGPIS